MTPQQFNIHLDAKQKEVEHAIRRTLPVKVGRMAADFYKENFRLGGFRDGALQPWAKTLRQRLGGRSVKSQYGPLMSGRENLRRSIGYTPGDARVTIGTSVPYAAIHNKGGSVTTHPRVTPKMRKFAWRQYFEAGGKKSPEAEKWKALALTKKSRLNVTANIPRRQFIGQSRELNEKIRRCIEEELARIVKS